LVLECLGEFGEVCEVEEERLVRIYLYS